MGVNCSVCKPPAEDPQPRLSLQASFPAGPAKKEQHDGQRRANLLVKEGGFALKNFNVTNPGRLEDHFEVDKQKIGEGGFGVVRKGKDKRTGELRAIKSIRKSAKEEVERMREEIEIMRLLDHPNIVRFVESFEDRRCIYIALELCLGGELFERICRAGCFTEDVGANCVKQMLLAINYLHQNFIVHRDLKPENWLFSTPQEVTKSLLKLIDFGISRRFSPGVPCHTKAGTPNYVAPEVLLGRYDEKVDIWSTGVITYVMLSGTHPFSGKSAEEVLRKVKAGLAPVDGPAWKHISAEGKGFVKICLQRSPGARLGASQACQHQWFAAKEPGATATVSKLELAGLQAFGRMHQLKRAVVTVVATQLSHSKIQSLRQMFMAMDKNNDGSLSVAEIAHGLESAGVALPRNLHDLLENVDTDGSGVVDYTEFLAATMDKKVYHQEDVVWNAFKKFDLDGSGAIDRSELGKVLGDDDVVEAMQLHGAGDRLQDIFDMVDSNGDGMIDFDEFFAMMLDKAGHGRDVDGGRPGSPSSAPTSPSGNRPKIGIGQAKSQRDEARKNKMRVAALF